ncbi:helix-turn-helix domain-containing protein [Runella slithyformis]|nr:helix-turn-helix transcriptional regulator [Runella slithyformis]
MDKNAAKSIEVQRIESLEFFLGWTKKRFAESLGLSASNYSKIINNGMAVPAKALYLLQSVHNVNLDWIYGKIESSKPVFLEDKEENKVRELERKLMKIQEELLDYKTRENEKLKNNPTVSAGQ